MIGHLETNLGHRIAEQVSPLGQRITDQGAALGAAFDRFERLVDSRFTDVNRRLDVMDRRFDGLDTRLDRVEGRLDRVEGRLEQLDEGFRGLRADVADHVSRHPA
ncbi:MAG TPA: hypothetical protein DCQ30_16095 [Acidimicrobiaceae bacterium]|nr:hypothetical protein [Acidimicrobiaceae bacterium]